MKKEFLKITKNPDDALTGEGIIIYMYQDIEEGHRRRVHITWHEMLNPAFINMYDRYLYVECMLYSIDFQVPSWLRKAMYRYV